METAQVVLLLTPLIAVQLVLMVVCLVDLLRPERVVAGGNKVVWGLVIVLGEIVGSLAYLFLGRRET